MFGSLRCTNYHCRTAAADLSQCLELLSSTNKTQSPEQWKLRKILVRFTFSEVPNYISGMKCYELGALWRHCNVSQSGGSWRGLQLPIFGLLGYQLHHDCEQGARPQGNLADHHVWHCLSDAYVTDCIYRLIPLLIICPCIGKIVQLASLLSAISELDLNVIGIVIW